MIQDLRNHGASSHHPKHDYMTLAEDVESFIIKHRLENSTLIGHSMYGHSRSFDENDERKLMVAGEQKSQ
jgi:predicted esterase YcpF (UPF0227 family)